MAHSPDSARDRGGHGRSPSHSQAVQALKKRLNPPRMEDFGLTKIIPVGPIEDFEKFAAEHETIVRRPPGAAPIQRNLAGNRPEKLPPLSKVSILTASELKDQEVRLPPNSLFTSHCITNYYCY